MLFLCKLSRNWHVAIEMQSNFFHYYPLLDKEPILYTPEDKKQIAAIYIMRFLGLHFYLFYYCINEVTNVSC